MNELPHPTDQLSKTNPDETNLMETIARRPIFLKHREFNNRDVLITEICLALVPVAAGVFYFVVYQGR